MLTDEQIKEEARKRIENMPDSQREEIENKIRKTKELSDMVLTGDYNRLSSKDKYNYTYSVAEKIRDRAGGVVDVTRYIQEQEVMKQFNCTREEVATMKKNPYKAGLLKSLLLAVLTNVGIIGASYAAKYTGTDLTMGVPILASLSGMFSFSFVKKIIDSIRFRKLQKSYDDPKIQEQEINGEVYKMLEEKVANERSR